MTMVSTRITLTGDVENFARTAGKMADTRPLLRQCGVAIMSRAVERVDDGMEGVSSGRLKASLMVGPEGGAGSLDAIFELTDERVTVGSNVPYAAQRHFGGTIRPKPGHKLLAIPLPDTLKRAQLWPRDLDPGHDILEFVRPIDGGAPVLVDEEGELGYGKGPLFYLLPSVTQGPRPFLDIEEETERVINEDLWPAFLELND